MIDINFRNLDVVLIKRESSWKTDYSVIVYRENFKEKELKIKCTEQDHISIIQQYNDFLKRESIKTSDSSGDIVIYFETINIVSLSWNNGKTIVYYQEIEEFTLKNFCINSSLDEHNKLVEQFQDYINNEK